jgi:hypothetical protein
MSSRFLNVHLLVFVGGAVFLQQVAFAQEKETKHRAGRTTSVTGCLEKQGDKPDEFSIVSSDGKKYGLRSNTVKLEEHLHHKVSVTGKLTREEHEGKAEKREAAEHAGKTEYGDLDVTNLKMISTSCP